MIRPEQVTAAAARNDRVGRMVAAEDLVLVGAGESPLEAIVRRHYPGPFPVVTADELPPLLARVDHGRWIVDCPWCPSASLASRDDLRFFCASCGNNGTGQWLVVEWPDEADRAEQILTVRPDTQSRNWWPQYEAFEDLARENEEHLR